MAVNSFREDEHIQATDAKKIVNRLLGYLKGYTKEVILVLVAMTITVGSMAAKMLAWLWNGS
mgnify:CR=1 FL=1